MKNIFLTMCFLCFSVFGMDTEKKIAPQTTSNIPLAKFTIKNQEDLNQLVSILGQCYYQMLNTNSKYFTSTFERKRNYGKYLTPISKDVFFINSNKSPSDILKSLLSKQCYTDCAGVMCIVAKNILSDIFGHKEFDKIIASDDKYKKSFLPLLGDKLCAKFFKTHVIDNNPFKQKNEPGQFLYVPSISFAKIAALLDQKFNSSGQNLLCINKDCYVEFDPRSKKPIKSMKEIVEGLRKDFCNAQNYGNEKSPSAQVKDIKWPTKQEDIEKLKQYQGIANSMEPRDFAFSIERTNLPRFESIGFSFEKITKYLEKGQFIVDLSNTPFQQVFSMFIAVCNVYGGKLELQSK